MSERPPKIRLPNKAMIDDWERIRQAKHEDVVPMTAPFTRVHLREICEQVGQIPVPRNQLLRLIWLAEEALHAQHFEFENPPVDNDREIILSMYRLTGNKVPPYFERNFGWKLEEPDEDA